MAGRHATISAWERDPHQGYYTADLHGFRLKVVWTPNTAETRGSFHWVADAEGEQSHRSHESFEEMEHAMADAERFAEEAAARRTATIRAAAR